MTVKGVAKVEITAPVIAEKHRAGRCRKLTARSKYRLTEKGGELGPVLMALKAWGERFGGGVR